MTSSGDYRPHAEFGINLSIPWSAGSREDPSYHVHAGAWLDCDRVHADCD